MTLYVSIAVCKHIYVAQYYSYCEIAHPYPTLTFVHNAYLSDVSDSENIRHRRGFVSGHDYLPSFFVDLHAHLLQIEGLGFGGSA